MGDIKRSAAKVLLVTSQLEVLLFSSLDPGDPSRPRYWFAIGGGVEPGESLETAAIREVFEETDLQLSEVGAPHFTRHTAFDFEDDHYEQDETYFVAWVERFTPTTDGWTELERRATAGHRWWCVDELTRTDETVYPEQLAELLLSLPRENQVHPAGPARSQDAVHDESPK
jgi:8-oxo-dGTP pyrophosphatase MutT (NUDIX family)